MSETNKTNNFVNNFKRRILEDNKRLLELLNNMNERIEAELNKSTEQE